MTTSRYATMWETAIETLERAERLHRQFFRLAGQPAQVPVWEPPIEMFEHVGRLVVVVALPGVPPDSIDVSLEGGTLIVAAERKLPRAFAGAAVHRLEIPYGRFERQVRLPSGHYRLVQRDSEHGCLLLAFERLD
ncbi:Hsp20/alpha crystallin family protein [Cupriavidus sp. IDO]|uniref:Hsp20/alpha crystallin family protein n=1 Tax=Cupriavidus sp. IDO TaxID=1539142 RepID=UPI000579555B|nr:Hsp20/alpha crystallin family protein [Cupriavidus sp. IDO]KWR74541.1 heat-shock protein Hsp20 [Cupriavidus sp. IDO]